MNLNRTIVVFVVLITGIFLAATGSFAAKGGNGGGKPPSEPPPACTDTFPGFVYTTGGTRKNPAETRLASSDGCRTESLGAGDMGGGPMHMTADRSKGVIVWVEGSSVRRLDFEVDGAGNLDAGDPVTILPLAGEEALPGDGLHYEVGDVWGDATHDSLYITVKRQDSFNSGPNAGAGTRVGLIYDLNTLNNVNDSPDVRTIFDQYNPGDGTPEYWDWLDAGDPSTLPDCYAIPNPQFVPTCYLVGYRMTFNPSGTRLYLERNLHNELRSEGEVYRGFMRINTEDMAAGLALDDWDLAGPELVFASETGLEGLLARPDSDPYVLPYPEIVTAGGQFLNADDCAEDYVDYADGMTLLPVNFWQACIDNSLVAHGNAMSWESPDSYLFQRLAPQGPGRTNIYRVYVSVGLADIEELLIETGWGADTGL